MDDKTVFTPEMLQQVQDENPFVRISDAVYNIVEDAILTSRIRPGSKIKINKIAEDLDVSGTPVREAVERLTDRGLVIESMGSGGKYKNYYVFDVDEEDISELFEARKAIESVACYICAKRNWTIDYEKLEEYTTLFKRSLSDYIESGTEDFNTMYDRQFHSFIVESAGNHYLSEMYKSLDKKLSYLSIRTCEYMASASRSDKLMMLCSQHDAILNAIRMGYPQLARDSMDAHIDFCEGNCLSKKKESEIRRELAGHLAD